MTKTNSTLTHERLLELVHYDPDTGVFTRLRDTKKNKAGTICETSHGKTGYTLIFLGQERYFAHRLAWFYVYRTWPKCEIDHKDRDPHNNRIDNLRDVSRSENTHNRVRPQPHNKTGLLGVKKHRNSFHARITVSKIEIHLGAFRTPEEAHAAYLAAKRKFHSGYLG